MLKIITRKMSLEEAKNLGVDTWGRWSCDVSTFDWEYDETETCYIFEGEVIVKTDYEEVHIDENTLVTFPKGLKCTWIVKRPIRKAYTFDLVQ
ncbi:MAG: cupin domain-containing protein [Caloramator sp.]|nr:cupin domain-containing protein [Caloramator sp.]